MRKHHVARVAVLVLVLTTAAVLVPTPGAAHGREVAYGLQRHEYATQITAVWHPLPALNRGATAAVLADRDLDRFERERA